MSKEQHPLSNEETLTQFLGSLSCNGCRYFVDDKCTHEKSEENEVDKYYLIDYYKEKGGLKGIEKANNINNVFVCENYESKTV